MDFETPDLLGWSTKVHYHRFYYTADMQLLHYRCSMWFSFTCTVCCRYNGTPGHASIHCFPRIFTVKFTYFSASEVREFNTRAGILRYRPSHVVQYGRLSLRQPRCCDGGGLVDIPCCGQSSVSWRSNMSQMSQNSRGARSRDEWPLYT